MNTQLDGRTALVTGSTGGIGVGIARALAGAGAFVVVSGRDEQRGAEVVAKLVADGGRATFVRADLAGGCASVRDLAAAAVAAAGGQVDVLVNNAACRQRYLFSPTGLASVLETKRSDWDAMLAVNLYGTLTMIRAFVTPMLARGRGSIINVGTRGSVLPPAAPGVWRGQHPDLRNQPYDASKAAMCSMSVYLAAELKDQGVAVNVVFPGATFTTGSAEIAEGRKRDGIVERPYLRPGHLAPVMKHLAVQAPPGETGLVIDSVQWNRDHGFGDDEQWWYRA